jgi:sugar phosphate isomerase/epimerase
MSHPRLSVNSLSSLHQSLSDDLALWQQLGVDHVGLISPKLEAVGWAQAGAMVIEAGLRVSNVSIERHALDPAVELAAVLGGGTVYLCSGPTPPSSTWDEAADRFCADIAPFVPRAKGRGVALAVEPTNPLRSDISFVFTLRDAIDLARAAGISVVLDVYSCWYERDIEALIREHVDTVALVQVCDYALGTFDTPNRAVPGEGDIPLERLVGMLLDAGYTGVFDLEILGPRIDDEGYRPTINRAVEHMSELLDRLGA